MCNREVAGSTHLEHCSHRMKEKAIVITIICVKSRASPLNKHHSANPLQQTSPKPSLCAAVLLHPFCGKISEPRVLTHQLNLREVVPVLSLTSSILSEKGCTKGAPRQQILLIPDLTEDHG